MCRLYRERDEMVYPIVSECSKLTQKELKTWYGWVGKVIQWTLFKRLKLAQNIKWYIHKPEFVLEIMKHKILGDFEVQTKN